METLSRRALLLSPAAGVLHGQESQPKMFADAEAYERFMGRWSRVVAPQLVNFAEVPLEGRMLDVGSGTGSLAFAIAEHRSEAQVLGIDPSKEYVAYAASLNRYAGRVQFDVGDAQQLRLPAASFDAALSLLVFNFIPDPKKALLEICRVTKRGGSVTAAVWDYGAGMTMLRTFWDAAVRVDPSAVAFDEKRMPLCREGELAGLWKQCGLSRVRERPIEISMRFESFADFWDPFLLGQGPAGAYVRRLERDKLHALREDIKNALSVTDEHRPFALPARAWSVRGAVPRRD